MISDITIGQYFPGESAIHKLDARNKILLTVILIVASFICKNFLSLACAVLGIIIIILTSKIPVRTILKSLKPLTLIIAITAILNIFYGDGEPLLTLGKLSVTADGLITALFTAIRIVALVVISSLLTYTTSPTELTDALERIMKPLKFIKIDVHSIAMTMTIALRFIPTLVEEIEKIMAAQKSRGADMDSGNLIKKVKALIPVLIPLFISSFRRANELAYAMECRCYHGGEGRTKMKVMKFGFRDYVAIVTVICFVALLILLNHLMSAVI